ncbi:hypothetical protein L7F22_036357 [Adiantum nelumboides]|nr:hypothetical protein [Adiantum nelumboides]
MSLKNVSAMMPAQCLAPDTLSECCVKEEADSEATLPPMPTPEGTPREIEGVAKCSTSLKACTMGGVISPMSVVSAGGNVDVEVDGIRANPI